MASGVGIAIAAERFYTAQMKGHSAQLMKFNNAM
jgi:hypothetical protein